MTKNGYTMVELLATIVIIALLGSIGYISYKSVLDSSAERVFLEYQDSMYSKASFYLLKRISQKSPTLPLRLSLDDIDIEPIKNPVNPDNTCRDNSYVLVTKNANCNILSYKYEVCLNCGDSYNNCKAYFDKDCN